MSSPAVPSSSSSQWVSEDQLIKMAEEKVKFRLMDWEPYAEALAGLDDDTFITGDFIDKHVAREDPSAETAEDVARRRNEVDETDVDTSTVIFLPEGDFRALIDEIRTRHKIWKRKPPKFEAVIDSELLCPCITVTRSGVKGSYVYHTQEAVRSQIRYGVKKVGEVEVNGIKAPVYAISHLDATSPLGNGLAYDEE